MSLYMETIFQNMVRQFTTIESDDRMVKDFIDATNAVLDELSYVADLSTPIAHISDTTSVVSELDAEHQSIMLVGIAAKLIEFGNEHAEGVNAYDRFERKWMSKKNEFKVMKSREDQDTQDDDGVPTSDTAGLGYLGDDD